MRIPAYIFLLTAILGLLLGFGIHGAWYQQNALSHFQSTSAIVLKNEVKHSRSGGFTPDVLYTYTVNGNIYESSRVAPLRINGSTDWAESVSRRIQAEASTAYYNPLDPSQAYLLPIGRFRPYGLILAAITLLTLSVFPVRAGGVLSRKPVAISGGPFDWYELSPGGSYPDRAMIWCTATVLWFVLGIAVIAHYYTNTPPAHELIAAASTSLYALFGLALACRAISACAVAARLGTTKAQMTQKTVTLGQPVIVRIEQPFMRDTQLRELRVTLTCYQRNGLGSVRYFAASHHAAEDRTVRAGEKIFGEFSFDIPHKKQRPSTLFTRLAYPRTDWLIEVTTRTPRSSVTVNFPILAEQVKQAAKAA